MRTRSSIPAVMLKHIQNYESSGTSLRVYCKNAGISFSKMQYLYYKKYRKGVPDVVLSTGFTEVALPTSPVNDGNYTVELKLPNGIQIVFNNSLSIEHLKALL